MEPGGVFEGDFEDVVRDAPRERHAKKGARKPSDGAKEQVLDDEDAQQEVPGSAQRSENGSLVNPSITRHRNRPDQNQRAAEKHKSTDERNRHAHIIHQLSDSDQDIGHIDYRYVGIRIDDLTFKTRAI